MHCTLISWVTYNVGVKVQPEVGINEVYQQTSNQSLSLFHNIKGGESEKWF